MAETFIWCAEHHSSGGLLEAGPARGTAFFDLQIAVLVVNAAGKGDCPVISRPRDVWQGQTQERSASG